MESKIKQNVASILMNQTDIDLNSTLKALSESFHGKVINDLEQIGDSEVIYLTGDIEANFQKNDQKTFYIVKEFSRNYSNDSEDYSVVNLGEVPINVHNVGIYFRNFFSQGQKDYFRLLSNQHQFQDLTESNKPGTSYRKGIYLSKVEQKGQDYHFNLLRCSTNLKGPTDNFRETDLEILEKVNQVAERYFEDGAELNHVLAQVYHNSRIDDKEKKAKIKDHADKTKDMPINGLMAFCTFYQKNDSLKLKESKEDPFDLCHSGQSVLTKLRFRKKKCVKNSSLVSKFDLTLYPNSVFLMPLSTNRFYTHEIIPSTMPVEKLPIRMGYVIRCSETEAIHRDGETFLVGSNGLTKLEKGSQEDIKKLKDTYYQENISDQMMNYGEVNFSLNDGDYLQPLV